MNKTANWNEYAKIKQREYRKRHPEVGRKYAQEHRDQYRKHSRNYYKKQRKQILKKRILYRKKLKSLKIQKKKEERNRMLSCLYRARTRCRNKNRNNYKYYGGKGIQCLLSKEDVIHLWYRDKGKSLKTPSLNRIDSNKNYEYSNCEFIEASENSRLASVNKRN